MLFLESIFISKVLSGESIFINFAKIICNGNSDKNFTKTCKHRTDDNFPLSV